MPCNRKDGTTLHPLVQLFSSAACTLAPLCRGPISPELHPAGHHNALCLFPSFTQWSATATHVCCSWRWEAAALRYVQNITSHWAFLLAGDSNFFVKNVVYVIT